MNMNMNYYYYYLFKSQIAIYSLIYQQNRRYKTKQRERREEERKGEERRGEERRGEERRGEERRGGEGEREERSITYQHLNLTSSPPRWTYLSGNLSPISPKNVFRKSYVESSVGLIGPYVLC